jgi:hypothetical protein
MSEALYGRLVADGEGRLYVSQTGDIDDTAVEAIFQNGIYVKAGNESHNSIHGKQIVEAGVGTHPDLYDENGVLVIPGDPHHEAPTPDDPHYLDPNDPNYEAQGGTMRGDTRIFGITLAKGVPTSTRLLFDDDATAATVTSHTEAYTNG